MSALRFGVVGLGVHGTRYANHLSAGDVPGAALAAVCRRNAREGQAYADEKGVAFYSDYSQLLADDRVDAVVVTAPPEQHQPIAEAAAAAGKHVLVEKPMARTVAECRAIIDACSAAGVKLMVAQTFRYNAMVIEMRRRVPDLGPIVSMSLCQRQEPSKAAWHHSQAASGGGNLLENGVHLLDAVRWLTGAEVLSAYCETSCLAGQETEDAFAAVLRLDTGCRCCVDGCKYSESRFAGIQVVGQAGQIIGSPSANSLLTVKGREVTAIEPPAPIPGLPCALDDFVKAIAEDTEPAITGADGLAVVAIVQACYRSAKEGRSVPVDT